MLRVGTVLRGIYRIDSYLSSGGFGNTYVATNIEFEERVAIKEFFMKGITERDETTCVVSVSNADNVMQFEEQREKFKKEARRLRKLRSGHIVKVHDLFEENGTAYYVMDFIDGESLAERIKRTNKVLAEAEVADLLKQVLEALREVHQHEIWHLDLKPGNIMLDKNGTAYLIDFGASKQIRANGSMTTSTALCYTPGYAPNEQIGQMYDRFGAWTDLYALGATIYNLLTNKKPPMAIDIEEDEEDAFAFPTSISEDMRKLVIWMMQPKRKKRPQSVKEVLEILDHQPVAPKESIHTSETESEETILISPTSTVKEDKVEKDHLSVANNTDDSSDKEVRTMLVISKEGKNSENTQISIDGIPQRAIKVGDFIYEDGSYSSDSNGKSVLGVLFSYYGGAHGQILSPVKPSEGMSINGKKLEWHIANIGEWVEVIQNLGCCKVNSVSWDYKYYSNDVGEKLRKYHIASSRYVTRKSVNGISYIVSLERGTLTPVEDCGESLPYIYVSEF